MRRFDELLKSKLAEKDFEKDYREHCNVCGTVWEIVKSVQDSGGELADLAKEIGIEHDKLLRFMEADNCQREIIVKLCAKYKIKLPVNCPRHSFDENR